MTRWRLAIRSWRFPDWPPVFVGPIYHGPDERMRRAIERFNEAQPAGSLDVANVEEWTLVEQLREALRFAGWRYIEMATATGVSPKKIESFRFGKDLTFRDASRLAGHLGLTLATEGSTTTEAATEATTTIPASDQQ